MRGRPERASFLVSVVSLFLVVGVAWVDYAAGVHVRTFPLYFVPVTLVSMRVGRGAGVVFALLCAAAWQVSNRLAGMVEATHAVGAVNTGVMLVTFVVVALLTAAQRSGLERERALSRTDSLTGLVNSRGFYEAAAHEIDRSARYRRPVTVAYVDLDDFKAVNDRLGHARGDELLVTVGRALRKGTRSSDLVARLGGDEFVILFPETDRAAAEAALSKIQSLLRGIVARRSLSVSASIGAVSYATPPKDVETLVHEADGVMYEAKSAGKNTVRCVDAAPAETRAATAGR
jgi:diguanylate cyclase (GGDEF)-like protein